MSSETPQTIADVARIAGVSASTVSRVINDSGYVGKKTRERVETVLKATGFTPNMAAKTLVTSRTSLIGLILPTFDNPVYLEILKGANEAATQAGYSVVIGQRGEDQVNLHESVMHLAALNVDGIISTLPEHLSVPAEEYLLPFIQKKFPLVQLGEGQREYNIDGVSTDAVATGRTVGDHLASLGHEHVAIIGTRLNPFTRMRIEGFEDAYIQAGIGTRGLAMFEADMSRTGGYRAACEVIACPERPSAIFALNDVMAIGAIMAAEEAGLRVPEDISVIGIDGIDLGTLMRPRLSTYALPLYEMGRELFALLHARISGAYAAEARTVVLGGRLVPRESTVPTLVRTS